VSRYWVIAPYNSTVAQVFDKAWEYDLQNRTIAVGWTELGDISKLSKPELKSKYIETYGDDIAKGSVTRDVNALWRFYHEVLPGDIVIARRGTMKIIGIGTVTGDPFYDREKGRERVADLTDDVYANFIPVRWNEKEITFDRIVFPFFTICEIPDEKYQRLVEGSEPDPEDEDVDIGQSPEFVLEKYLEDFIVANFESIFAGKWKLYEDSEGSLGQQYPARNDSGKLIGRIDILARSTNSYLVIELKKGRESDKVVGQILRYMGWVRDNLCREGEDVKGLIICKDVDERLTYALGMVQDIVQVKRYSINFQLSDD
jgi:hypothetical protein